jgi:hypothetical protein
MQLAVIGLPNSSKTTVFNALTRGHAETTAYSSGTLDVQSATVDVPDRRVDQLAALFKPRKTTRAQVTYSDIAGLGRGVNNGGLSGPLLNVLSQSDALLHVVRAFEDPDVPHSQGSLDPRRDLAIVDDELLLSDMILVERRIERLESQLKKGGGKPARAAHEAELALFQRLRAQLEGEAPLRDMELAPAELKLLRPYGLLTLKPVLVVLNVGEVPRAGYEVPHTGYEVPHNGRDHSQPAGSDGNLLAGYRHRHTSLIELQGRLEMELAHMAPDEAAEFLPEYGIQEPGLQRAIRLSYALLGLHSFFTVGEDEVRAWTIPTGATAVEAAGAIHTDLARGFIRAEVVSTADLMASGSLAAARQRGQLRLEGKDYVVQDGDILSIRFNV